MTSSQAASADRHTIEDLGVPSCSLMELAASALADEALILLRSCAPGGGRSGAPFLVLAGSGNNGGDGFACARILNIRGYDADILFTGSFEKMTVETERQYEICKKLGMNILEELPDLSEYDVIIDAMFGNGLKGALRDRAGLAADALSDFGGKLISCDIPSGVDPDTGRVCENAVKADVTVAIEALRPGHLLYPGAGHCGEVRLAQIGIDTGYISSREPVIKALDADDLREIIPSRRPDGNKWDFGKVFVCAGSVGMCGAAYLASLSALRSGAGMVRILTPRDNMQTMQQLIPEAVLSVYDSADDIPDLIEEGIRWADVVIAGPGLGRGEAAVLIMETLMANDAGRPLVLDADGLNILSASPEIISGYPGRVLITPHIVELSRLTGKTPDEIKDDLIGAAASTASRFGCDVILKDARSVAVTREGDIFINTSGSDALATAGSGDVLTGVCAALMACEGMEDTSYAAPAAAFLHGLMGERAAERRGSAGVIASDIADCASAVRKETVN